MFFRLILVSMRLNRHHPCVPASCCSSRLYIIFGFGDGVACRADPIDDGACEIGVEVGEDGGLEGGAEILCPFGVVVKC